VKENGTIFDDRETVELLSEQPELLAIADAIRATRGGEARAWGPQTRLLLVAAAVASFAAAGALLLTGLSGGHPASAPSDYRPLDPLHHLPRVLAVRPRRLIPHAACSIHRCGGLYGAPTADQFDDTITRTDGAITSIAVTVFGERVDSTATLEVHMDTGEVFGGGHVVFSKHVSLNSSPSPPRWGTVSEWSGTLSPSDWDGGCQNAAYWLSVRIRETDHWVTEIQPPSFNCQRTVVGPTGKSGPIRG
jgi:hypothetical protein